MLDLIKELNGCLQTESVYDLIDGQFIVLSPSPAKVAETINKFTSFKAERYGPDRIRISLLNLPIKTFFNDDHFVKNATQEVFDNDFFILLHDKNNDPFQFKITDHKFENGIICNTYSYLVLKSLFTYSQLINYWSNENREFVLVLPDVGTFAIGYPLFTPSYTEELNVLQTISGLEEKLKSEGFGLFYKKAVFDFCAQVDKEKRFPYIFEKCEEIFEQANRDYELYLSKFSIKKLLEEYRREKDEHFSKIREIVNGLITKIVAIPVSISAAIIAVFNTKNDVVAVVIINLGYIIYSIFNYYLLCVIDKDRASIKEDLEKDIQIIAESTKIKKGAIEKEAIKVGNKLDQLRKLLLGMKLITVIFLFLLLGYSIASCPTFNPKSFFKNKTGPTNMLISPSSPSRIFKLTK